MKVTWLLPVKNGMPYLPETLASIEAQTYQNWEVLAWDNGSTDATVEELCKWIPSRLAGQIVTDRPTGLGASLAEMVKICRTELCARIDADDVNVPERLEKQVAFLETHLEVAVVGSLVNHIDSQGVNHGLRAVLPLTHDDIVHTLLSGNGIAHPTVLFRRSVVLEVGNYRDVGPINIEDYDLWFRVAMRHRLANINEALLHYRIHDKSVTQIAMAQNSLMGPAKLRYCEHAPQLFGCSNMDAELLHERKHPCAIRVLYQILKHLTRTQGGNLIDRLRSESFISAGRLLVSPEDKISRLSLAALNQNWKALPREIATIIRGQ